MEFEILYFLQGLHQPLLDRLMVGITSLGNGGWFWIALTVLFLCLPKYRRCGITMAVALVMNFLICNVAVKNLVARERPCWIDPSVELLIPVPKDFSFPSGHSSVSFAAAAAIFLFLDCMFIPLHFQKGARHCPAGTPRFIERFLF